MSIVFFRNVLAALGKKLNYESLSNLYGNSFCKEASNYISEAHPLRKHSKHNKAFINMVSASTVIKATKKPEDKAKAISSLSEGLGDLSWAEGLI